MNRDQFILDSINILANEFNKACNGTTSLYPIKNHKDILSYIKQVLNKFLISFSHKYNIDMDTLHYLLRLFYEEEYDSFFTSIYQIADGSDNSSILLIPEGIEEVYFNYKYDYIKSIQTLILSSTVKEIVADSFSHCTKLQEVIIPKNSQLEKIGINAFYNCSNLSKINIPENVKIEEQAFTNTLYEKQILYGHIHCSFNVFKSLPTRIKLHLCTKYNYNDTNYLQNLYESFSEYEYDYNAYISDLVYEEDIDQIKKIIDVYYQYGNITKIINDVIESTEKEHRMELRIELLDYINEKGYYEDHRFNL